MYLKMTLSDVQEEAEALAAEFDRAVAFIDEARSKGYARPCAPRRRDIQIYKHLPRLFDGSVKATPFARHMIM